eukprot:COSAG06_NODE_13489_length_1252_cov_5.811795_1_plen_109_part_00
MAVHHATARGVPRLRQTGQPASAGGHLTLTSQLAACTRQVIEEKAEEFEETFLSTIDECCAAVPGVSACLFSAAAAAAARKSLKGSRPEDGGEYVEWHTDDRALQHAE